MRIRTIGGQETDVAAQYCRLYRINGEPGEDITLWVYTRAGNAYCVGAYRDRDKALAAYQDYQRRIEEEDKGA